MLDFIYDSLDTVKHLKHPNKKLYVTLTIAIFCVVIFAGFYFILADAIFGEWYKMFYQMMRDENAIETVVDDSNSSVLDSYANTDLPAESTESNLPVLPVESNT